VARHLAGAAVRDGDRTDGVHNLAYLLTAPFEVAGAVGSATATSWMLRRAAARCGVHGQVEFEERVTTETLGAKGGGRRDHAPTGLAVADSVAASHAVRPSTLIQCTRPASRLNADPRSREGRLRHRARPRKASVSARGAPRIPLSQAQSRWCWLRAPSLNVTVGRRRAETPDRRWSHYESSEQWCLSVRGSAI
jgi:hypothetical protein